MDKHQWYWRRYTVIAKMKRKKQYHYCIFDNSGTFLEGSHLLPWQLALFVNHWVQKKWNHKTFMRCLGWSEHTTVDWRSFCSEVMMAWLNKEQPIGGEGIVVQIDETFFVKKKYEQDRQLSDVWMFSGIQRELNKKFIVPLPVHQDNQYMSARILIPLIKKYILSGSIIMSDGWKAYSSLNHKGYTHRVINHKSHSQWSPYPQCHVIPLDFKEGSGGRSPP